jgi:hypothetical protein
MVASAVQNDPRITQFVFAVGILVVFLIVGFSSVALLYRIIGDANEKLEPENQFGYFWISPFKLWRLYSAHRRLYPHSRVRILSLAPAAVWLLLIVIAARYFR